MLNDALAALVTMLVVTDPIGIAPIYISMTDGMPAAMRQGVGIRAARIATLVLAGTALVGSWLLVQLEIGLPAFRISGGLLLFAIAFDMVFGSHSTRAAQQVENTSIEHTRDVAVFPLAIPLIAGPGAITATLLLAGRVHHDIAGLTMLIGVIVVTGGVCLITFLLAERIVRTSNIIKIGVVSRLLGVLSRLLGVLLAALAVQFVIDGARAAFS